jgi:tripartite-type tricarboxylate transporter receptor subunit TctC
MMAALATISVTGAQAQTYPARPVNVIVSLAAGTGMDTLVRVYTDRLSQRLGQPLVVENRPGSAGLAAGEAIAKSTPDGHTLGVFTSAVMAIRPTLLKSMPFSPSNDFVPISQYVKSPFVFIVDAKERPGKLSYSSSGVGGAPHLTAELLKQKFAIDVAHVPYRNSPQSIADVAAGHVQMAIAEAGASLPLIKDGKLRALAVTSLTRFASIPDVPTLAQATGDAELEAVSWHILVARAGTPAPIAGRLHQEMKQIMALPDVKEKVEAIGLIPHETPSIEGMTRYIKAETEKWGSLVRSLGLEGSE